MSLDPLIEKLCSSFAVRAILCYGSYATGLHDARSDIDLLVLVEGELPQLEARSKAYQSYRVDSLDFTATVSGDWDNSWSPINDRLHSDGRVVEIGYNRVEWMDSVLDKLLEQGQVTFPEFAFRPYTILGLLDTAKVLFEKEGYISRQLKRLHPIPAKLKEAIFKTNMGMLEESFSDFKDCVERKVGILSTAFFLFRAIDALNTLLFLLNDAYDPASKRIEAHLYRLAKQPPGFRRLLEQELPCFYENQERIVQSLEECLGFVRANK